MNYSINTPTTTTNTINNNNNNNTTTTTTNNNNNNNNYLQNVPEYLTRNNFYSTSNALMRNLFPMQMNPKDKHSTIELGRQYMRISYQGSGKSDSDAASVRSRSPIPPQLGIFYFESFIVSKGRDGYIGIGFCGPNVSLQRLPGWELNSWGYHGDDGNCFSCSGTGKHFGPTFTTGDTIGCGIDFVNKRAFYTKNGIFLGYPFNDLPTDKISLFPCIGLRTPGEIVQVEFTGKKKKFLFDIQSYIDDLLNDFVHSVCHSPTATTIATTTSDDNPSYFNTSTTHLNITTSHLIVKHLLYHGHLQAATSLVNSLSNSTSESLSQLDIQRCHLKQQMKQLILSGNGHDQLLHIIHSEFTLSSEDLIIFYIKCQKFLDLVYHSIIATSSDNNSISDSITTSENDEYERLKTALEYGQSLQNEYRLDERCIIQQKLVEIFSVLAYPNPLVDNPSIAHLFSTRHKLDLFEMINSRLFGEDDLLGISLKSLLLNTHELGNVGDGSFAFLSHFISEFSSSSTTTTTTTTTI